MEAVVYTRVSRLTDGRSTQDQEKECRAWCQANGHDVEEVFTDDGISASRYGKNRDAWTALKEYLRPGHILVAWSSSRTTRDLGEFVALRNLCASLNVPLAYSGRVLDLTQGDDRFVGGLDALIAERESETIKANVLRGKRQSAAAGTPSGPPPWGYQRVAPKEWIPDPVEAPRVRMVARKILDGEGMRSCYRWLKEHPGYVPSNITMLRRAIVNPALAGLRVHRGAVVEGVKGTWEPILSLEDHTQLVAIVERNRRLFKFQSPPGPEPLYLLSGIALCSVCTQPLRHRSYANRKDCYLCNDGHVSRIAEELDRRVLNKLFERLSEVNPEDHDQTDPGIEEAFRAIGELTDTLEEWIVAAENGEVTPQAFARIEKGLRGRIDELRQKTASAPIGSVDVDSLRANWENYPMSRKREVIRAFMTITVPPVGRMRALPGDVIIERK